MSTGMFSACEQNEAVAPVNVVTDEVKANLTSLGFDVSDIQTNINRAGYLPEDKGGDFLLEGDIHMTLEALDAMVAQRLAEGKNGQPSEEQYHTNSLVNDYNGSRTITVIGYTGGSYALTNVMRNGLSWAIDNYNALNLGLRFQLSFTASTNADIVVYRNYTNSGAGGSAGFPSGGNPNKYVQIYAGMNSYNTNVNEHVIGHEIGHSLGLRHTDYFSRFSCGQNSNEGSAGVGANHIPGTGTDTNAGGFDYNSLMLACFSSSEDGEFSSQDVTALRYLY